MNEAKLIGKAVEFITSIQANATALNAAGFPVNAVVKDLEAKKDTLTSHSAEQEGLKTSLKDKTEEVNAAVTALYDTFSSKVDAACGAVGKKTNLAKQLARVRSSLRSSNSTDAAAGESITSLAKAA